MRRLGIDCLSIFGLPPVPFVQLAADLGCDFITLGLPVTYNPEDYPPYSLADPALQRELKAALRESGIALQVGEGYFLRSGLDMSAFAASLDTMAELGALFVNTLSVDPDLPRSLDQFSLFAEMAAARGMRSSLEFIPGSTLPNVAAGVAALRQVDRPDMKLVIDMMHLGRSGGTTADLPAIDPELIGYIQLCDCRIEPVNQVHETMYERMAPGTGELPLHDILAALPRDIPVGVEIPQRSLSEAGLGPRERLTPCIAAARALLASLDEG